MVWTLTSDPELVLKLYRQGPAETGTEFSARLKEASEKVPAMIARPPHDPNRGHISIAWPVDTVQEAGLFVGFLMPYMKQQAEVIYNYQQPKQRRDKHPGFTRKHCFQAASNLASAVNLIHHAGHVIGDMNPANILCRDDGLVTFIDTDSFQIKASNSKCFRCQVAIDDWIAPEIQGKKRGSFDWLETHDRFALAVHIFELLVGFHPFNGVLKNAMHVNRVNVYLIENGIFPYIANNTAEPPPVGPARFAGLSSEVQTAFIKTFHGGSSLPHYRLTPDEWITLLTKERDALVQCPSCSNWSEPHFLDCLHCRGLMPDTGAQTTSSPSSATFPQFNCSAGNVSGRGVSPEKHIAAFVKTHPVACGISVCAALWALLCIKPNADSDGKAKSKTIETQRLPSADNQNAQLTAKLRAATRQEEANRNLNADLAAKVQMASQQEVVNREAFKQLQAERQQLAKFNESLARENADMKARAVTPFDVPTTVKTTLSVDVNNNPQAVGPTTQLTKPGINELFIFVKHYVAADSSIVATAEYIAFPIDYFTHGPLTYAKWASKCEEYAKQNPVRQYQIIGNGLVEPLGKDQWSVIVAIDYRLQSSDRHSLAGIALSEIGVMWKDSALHVISHKQLGSRTTFKDGHGISPDDWRPAKTAYTRDGSTNIRSIDNDNSEDTILRKSPVGENLKVLQEAGQNWWIVQDTKGIVGFMASRYIVSQPRR